MSAVPLNSGNRDYCNSLALLAEINVTETWTFPLDEWKVNDPEDFLAEVHEIILDNGIRAPIFGAHYLKTTLAIESEITCASKQTQSLLLAALNRFVHSPIKQKHSRRLAHQAIALVARDFDFQWESRSS